MQGKRVHELAAVSGVVAFMLCAIWSKPSLSRQQAEATDGADSTLTVLYDTIITFRKAPPFTISPYDRYLRQYSDSIGWDWKWLAAIAYYESRFNPEAQNTATGAAGLMQLMPQTAASMGVDTTLYRTDPRENIKAAARLFKRLDRMFFSSAMPDRVCFVLAAYNAGHAHVLDAIRLAEKYGSNRKQWFGNVEYFMTVQNDPKYYNDSVCHYGPFGGKETTDFVKNVWEKYMEYSRLEHLYFAINHADTVIVPRTDDTGHEAPEQGPQQAASRQPDNKSKN